MKEFSTDYILNNVELFSFDGDFLYAHIKWMQEDEQRLFIEHNRDKITTSKTYDWYKSFLNIAYTFAVHSTCIRKQVGAVIVKDKRIISTGYNGVPSGVEHCNERFKNINVKEWADPNSEAALMHHKFSSRYELHAEQNAIAFTAKTDSSPLEGATIFTTLSPCNDCAKLIKAAGIRTVVFDEPYDRDTSSLEFLKEAGIHVIPIRGDIHENLQGNN